MKNKYYCSITSMEEYRLLQELGLPILYVGIVLRPGGFDLNSFMVVYLDDGPGDLPSEWEQDLGELPAGDEFIQGFFELTRE